MKITCRLFHLFPRERKRLPIGTTFSALENCNLSGRSVKVEPQRKRFTPFDELIRRVIYDWAQTFDEANKPPPPQTKQTAGISRTNRRRVLWL
jgi:hypothetical protein